MCQVRLAVASSSFLYLDRRRDRFLVHLSICSKKKKKNNGAIRVLVEDSRWSTSSSFPNQAIITSSHGPLRKGSVLVWQHAKISAIKINSVRYVTTQILFRLPNPLFSVSNQGAWAALAWYGNSIVFVNCGQSRHGFQKKNHRNPKTLINRESPAWHFHPPLSLHACMVCLTGPSHLILSFCVKHQEVILPWIWYM